MDDSEIPVLVPRRIMDALQAVRESGLTNMIDLPAVGWVGDQLGYPELGEWIAAHKRDYSRGIFRGFDVDWDAQEPTI